MENTSRKQRKRRPEVYITEAQKAQMAKGRDPKRWEAPRRGNLPNTPARSPSSRGREVVMPED